MTKRLALAAIMLMLCVGSAQARARYTNWCQVGNQAVTIAGAGTSTTKWMLSGPSCTVTVYDTGTLNLSSLYSDNVGTPLNNPFAAASNGAYFFYADDGSYDVVTSSGGLPTPVTIGAVSLIDPATLPGASTLWSGLTTPTANLALGMSTYTSAFTWGNMTGVSNAFSLADGSASTSTGSLFKIATGSGSTMKPFTATAQGTSNGVQMSTAGALAAIGSGSIAASTLSCSLCVTDSMIQSVTSRSKLPAAIAYEDEANEFTTGQTFDTTIALKGSTAFAFTIGGTPTANRTITIPDATSTLVNLASTQTLAGKTFSDNLQWQSGTAFTGTLDHAITADRTWVMPDAAGTVLLAPTLTSGSVMTTNGTTLTQDNATFFWNTTTKRLGIGNAAPAASLHVQPRAAASEVAMRVQGDSTANTDVLQVYNSAASPAKISYFGSNGALNTSLSITSTLATGTAPFVVASTTPVANLTAAPTTYDHSGSQQAGVHIVQDTCTLGTDCAVTLVGSAIFTSSTSYTCTAQDGTAAAATKIVQSSGSAFTITGTGTDVLRYICIGN